MSVGTTLERSAAPRPWEWLARERIVLVKFWNNRRGAARAFKVVRLPEIPGRMQPASHQTVPAGGVDRRKRLHQVVHG
jgi:hypothetical protein